MGKPNRTGRDVRDMHYTTIQRALMKTPAWRALSTTAQALYPWLRLEWHGPNANNNGKLQFSVRQAAAAMGVATNTAAAAFHSLQAKGFLVMTEPAALGVEGYAKCPSYELTELPLPGGSGKGKQLYLLWSEGGDFSVERSPANNPTGRRKKQRPVSETKTVVSQNLRRSRDAYLNNCDDLSQKLRRMEDCDTNDCLKN